MYSADLWYSGYDHDGQEFAGANLFCEEFLAGDEQDPKEGNVDAPHVASSQIDESHESVTLTEAEAGPGDDGRRRHQEGDVC